MTRTVKWTGTLGELTKDQRDELRAAARRSEDEVDTSDISETTDEWFERAERGRAVRRYNNAAMPLIDGAVLEWLRPEEPGFRDRLNDVLRKAMKLEQNMTDHPEAAE